MVEIERDRKQQIYFETFKVFLYNPFPLLGLRHTKYLKICSKENVFERICLHRVSRCCGSPSILILKGQSYPWSNY